MTVAEAKEKLDTFDDSVQIQVLCGFSKNGNALYTDAHDIERNGAHKLRFIPEFAYDNNTKNIVDTKN